MKQLQLDAPAKVNLGLRILARRPDGYHEIESLFAPLDLCDELELEIEEADAPSASLELFGDAAGVPADGANLALRAAEAFLAAGGLRCAVRLRLTKRVPVAAGLGGGSSDAGAVLRGLATLCPDALPPDALVRLALELGADVPFFLDPTPALVGGVGERAEPLPALAGLALLLANPGLPVSTAAVYEAFDVLNPGLAGSGQSARLRARIGQWATALPPSRGSAAALAELLANDLEAAAIRLCPPVARLRRDLRAAGALAVGMSGSGPTVFGVFEDASRAREARARLAPDVWARVAMTVRTR